MGRNATRATLTVSGVLLILFGIASFLFVPFPKWGTALMLACGATAVVVGTWVLE
jgi:hypothetical protein